MKTIKYIALGVLATSMTLVNTSCSDSFLEVENPSGENLWRNIIPQMSISMRL